MGILLLIYSLCVLSEEVDIFLATDQIDQAMVCENGREHGEIANIRHRRKL